MASNSNVMPTRSMIIISSKDHPKCKEAIELLKNKEVFQKFKDNMLNVMIQDGGGIETPETKKLFRIDLYDFNMRLIQTFNNITNVQTVFDEILKLVQKMGLPNKTEVKSKQKGGYIDYEKKYKKYKKKYKMMDKIVIGYY
jgi:hypothetical protein